MPIGDILLTVVYMMTLFYTIFWLLTLLDIRDSPRLRLSKLPKVSIVIPAFNEEEYLEKSVLSVLDLNYPKNQLEIIIVDDGSTDNTFAIAEKLQADHKSHNIITVQTPNRGKWSALNEGIKISTGEFFACLDADSFVNKQTLINALPYFGDDKVAVVLPLLKVKDPKTFFQRVQWYEYIINMFYKKLIGFLNSIHVAPGPFSIYRTDVVRKIGGFKQAHFTEDLEIILRLQEHQYKIVQITDSEVYTVAPKNIKGVYRQRFRWFRGSLLNVWDYRRMLFNAKYGDFGMFQLPVVLFNGLIAIVLVTLTLYFNLLDPLINRVQQLFLINFDILTLLNDFSFSFNIIDFNFYKLFIMMFFILLSFVVVALAHRYTKENILKYGVKSLLFFLFFYYLTLAAVWVKLFVDLLLRKEHKW